MTENTYRADEMNMRVVCKNLSFFLTNIDLICVGYSQLRYLSLDISVLTCVRMSITVGSHLLTMLHAKSCI